jgi:hypothetical protein
MTSSSPANGLEHWLKTDAFEMRCIRPQGPAFASDGHLRIIPTLLLWILFLIYPSCPFWDKISEK